MTEQTKTPKVAPPVDELDELAKAALRARASAPVSCGTKHARIPQKEILARLNKQQGGADVEGGMHRLFVPQADLREYAYRGYVRCRDESGNDATYKSDIAVEIPTAIYQKELDAVSAMTSAACGESQRAFDAPAEQTGLSDELKAGAN